jgi:EmrB/QacA subfamily drug resistance transporter
MTSVPLAPRLHHQPATAGATSHPLHKWWALALLAGVQFMLILDTSIVNVALPSIDRHFTVGSQSSLSWVVNGYLLTFGGLLLLGGRLGDRIGRRKMFLLGAGVFGAASLGAGLAPSFGLLITARLVQGAGGAMVAPAALGLVTVIFSEGSERNKAMGVWGAVSGTGGGAGLIFGGVLTTGLGWEWVFYVNLPIVVAALLLTKRLLPESVGGATDGSFDLPGATAVVLGIAALVYGFVAAGNDGWSSARTLVFLSAGAALLAAFAAIETRAPTPLIRLSIFRSRTITGANLASLTFGMASLAVWFYLALYLQQVHGYSALKAGLASLPLNAAIAVLATLSAKWITKIGPKPVLAAGLLIFGSGMIWFHFITAYGSYATEVLGPIIVMGAGLGMAFVGMTVAAVTGIDPDDAGIASGLLNTTTQVGAAIGLAVMSTVSTTTTSRSLSHHNPTAVALTAGFRDAIVVGVVFAVMALLIALFVLSTRANRDFVQMVAAGDNPQLQEAAEALAELDSAAAIAAVEEEHAVDTATNRRPDTSD